MNGKGVMNRSLFFASSLVVFLAVGGLDSAEADQKAAIENIEISTHIRCAILKQCVYHDIVSVANKTILSQKQTYI